MQQSLLCSAVLSESDCTAALSKHIVLYSWQGAVLVKPPEVH
jgi:hypothetical protein